MLRLLYMLTLAAFCFVSSGCAMCCAPYDYDYAAFGGRWERYDMTNGRAGSAFAPAADAVHDGQILQGAVETDGAPQIIEDGAAPYYEQIEAPESGLEGYSDGINGN